MENDLLIYLHSCLKKTRLFYSLDPSWPSVMALAHLSSGLFIFVATAAQFIQDRHIHDPPHQLAHLLGIMNTGSSSHDLLDHLYTEVLQSAFPNISSEYASRLKTVLGSVALLCNPPSPSDLEQLLGIYISITLQALQSVVILPNDKMKSGI